MKNIHAGIQCPVGSNDKVRKAVRGIDKKKKHALGIVKSGESEDACVPAPVVVQVSVLFILKKDFGCSRSRGVLKSLTHGRAAVVALAWCVCLPPYA